MMMKKITYWASKNTLFLRIVCIVCVSIITVAGFLSMFIIKLSESSYMNTYSQASDILLKQINNSYYDLHEDIIDALGVCNLSNSCKTYLAEKNLSAQEESIAAYEMAIQFKGKGLLRDNISSNLVLVGFNGKTYVNNAATKRMNADEILQSEAVRYALQHPDEVIYQYSKDQFTSNITRENAIVAIKVLKDTNREPYGISMVILNQDDFMKFYDSLIDSSVNQVMIMNEHGQILSSNDYSLVGKTDVNRLKQVKKQWKEKVSIHTYHDKKQGTMTSIVKEMPYYDSYLVSIVDNSIFVSSVNRLPVILMACAIISAIVIFIVFLLIRKTMRPVRELSQKMPEITNGNFDNHVEEFGSGEVKELSLAFNYMLDGLHDYVEKLMKLQEEKRLAEIHALQMQINPHFIYNTLTSIKFMAWQGNKEKLVQTIDAFIQLLRNTISNTDEVVSVVQEIENVKNYVQIQMTRYGDKVSVRYFIQDACTSCYVLKMILQPFIENAFFHAFSGMEKGTIDVFGKIKGEKLIFEIIDNGSGIEQHLVQGMMTSYNELGKHFSGIGIHNVNDRIQLLYGKEYGVIVSSTVGLGTIVTVTLPLLTSLETKQEVDDVTANPEVTKE